MTSQEQRRVLVVADVWCRVDGLCHEVSLHAGGPSGEIFVVAPALVGRLRTWVSDVDAGQAAARERLDAILQRLDQHGVAANGRLGATDPLLAIEDALAHFHADEIMLVTEHGKHETWREHGLDDRALERFGLPITHLTVAHEETI